jgi:hypothetical protein
VMQGSPVEAWVLRVLDCYGPQDLRSLLWLLESDPEFGHIPMNDNAFESKLRVWLKANSECHGDGLIRREGYKWSSNIRNLDPRIDLPRLTQYQPWVSLGEGSEFVYGLFHPASMHKSRLDGLSKYPIKIGRTRRDITSRILELQTGSYQKLQLGILIRTSDSIATERTIHAAFKGCRLKILELHSEWFLTSLNEIRDYFLQEKGSQSTGRAS